MTDVSNKCNSVEVFLDLDIEDSIAGIAPDRIFRNFLPDPHIIVKIDFIGFENFLEEFPVVIINRSKQFRFWNRAVQLNLLKIQVNAIIEFEFRSIFYLFLLLLSISPDKRKQ